VRLLSIDWIEKDLPSSAEDGYGSSSYLPLSELAKEAGGIVFDGADQVLMKPVIVYFYSGRMDEEKLEKTERKMFGNDDLAIATKFYRCLRIDADQISSEKIRALYVKKLPTLYVLNAEGKVLARKEGALSAPSILGELKRAYKKVHGVNLAPRIKSFSRFLDRLDKASDKVAELRARLAAAEERLARKETPRNKKKVQALLEQVEKAEEALAALETEKEKLLLPPTRKEVARRR